MKLLVLFCVVTLLSFALVVYTYLGGFEVIKIKVGFFGPTQLVYKLHIGAYHKINHTIIEVENKLKQNGHECHTTFGQYLNDPREVQTEHLKSYGGCVVEDAPQHLHAMYQSKTLQKTKAVIAQFKGSPAIGPLKVYPKIEKFITSQNLIPKDAPIELYTFKGKSMITKYIFPIQ